MFIMVVFVVCGMLVPHFISADDDFTVWAGVCMCIGVVPICYFLGSNIFKSIKHKTGDKK